MLNIIEEIVFVITEVFYHKVNQTLYVINESKVVLIY